MDGHAQAAASAEVLTGLLDSGADLRAELKRENAAAREECQRQEAEMAGATVEEGSVAVGQRLGVSASRSQGMYGVNSVVYQVVVRGQECALKAIITAYGPFTGRDGAKLEQAVRDELLQPPHSPHLLRYHAHFNGIVEGDLAREWPRDVQTTPIGSLTKFMLMPLMPDGNLQAYARANPVREEATFLAMVLQLLKGIIALVDAGLLHRDIKLDNVLVRLDPEGGAPFLLLADFGTLQPMVNQERGCTPGNPMKVAPELRTLHNIGREVAAAVDLTKAEVWAVGALCFDLLDGRAPYEQQDSTSLPDSPAVSVLGRAMVSRMLS